MCVGLFVGCVRAGKSCLDREPGEVTPGSESESESLTCMFKYFLIIA